MKKVLIALAICLFICKCSPERELQVQRVYFRLIDRQVAPRENGDVYKLTWQSLDGKYRVVEYTYDSSYNRVGTSIICLMTR